MPVRRPHLRWGYVQAAPRRYGVVRFRLVVLAPGATGGDYARLRFGDMSVWLGTGTWAGAMTAFGAAVQRPDLDALGLMASGAFALLVGGLVHLSARRVRGEAREAWVCLGPAPVSLGLRAVDLAGVQALRLLSEADELCAENRINEVEYELAWIRAWNLLPPGRSRRHGRGGRR